MTAFVRSWLVMASVLLLSSESGAQYPPYGGAAAWQGPSRPGFQRDQMATDPDYELLPDDRGPWQEFDEQFALTLKDVVAESWISLEYLNASFERPGNTLLGAPIASVPDPRQPFNVTAGAVLDGRAIVPDASRLELGAQNGVRTTIGINSFRDFSIEASYVGMQNMVSGFQLVPSNLDPVDFPGSIQFYATSVLDAGSPGSRVILYDRLFEVGYSAQYWSGEVNVLLNNRTRNTGFVVRPLLGFRFNSYGEDLVQHGEFDNNSGVDATLGTLTTPHRNTIRNSTQNTFYMGQIGFQAELVEKWFTIGVAPKLAVGANKIGSHVMTEDLRDSLIAELANDGVTSANQSSVVVGTNLDLNGYLKIRVNPWLSLTGSAFYWWMPNVARTPESIVYDDLGIDVAPAIRPGIETRSMGVKGFTVGAEIKF